MSGHGRKGYSTSANSSAWYDSTFSLARFKCCINLYVHKSMYSYVCKIHPPTVNNMCLMYRFVDKFLVLINTSFLGLFRHQPCLDQPFLTFFNNYLLNYILCAIEFCRWYYNTPLVRQTNTMTSSTNHSWHSLTITCHCVCHWDLQMKLYTLLCFTRETDKMTNSVFILPLYQGMIRKGLKIYF